jgi:hypothetical protein
MPKKFSDNSANDLIYHFLKLSSELFLINKTKLNSEKLFYKKTVCTLLNIFVPICDIFI